ncbi:MAG: phospholipid carrier-dependent glycosyltransferase [Candidatus Sericytochromatia bacterium]
MNAEQTHFKPKLFIQQRLPFFQQKQFWILLLIFASAFLLRLALTNVLHGHPTDIVNFKAWSMHAARHPFMDFYKSVNESVGIWADYPPLYILVLWAVGKVGMIFDPNFAHWNGPLFTLLIKLPPILADLGCMGFLLLILKRYVPYELALLALVAFALHPAVIYESSLWGQVDSITLLLQLAALWLLIRKDYSAAILVTTLNILVKPQGIILMPLVILFTLYRKQWLHLGVGVFASLLVTTMLTALFVPFQRIAPWLWDQYVNQANLYQFSSIQAFNLWSLTGMWASDVSRGIFGIGNGDPLLSVWLQHKTWGLILFSLAYSGALLFFWRNDRRGEDEGVNLWHTSSLIMIAFFLFPTRMHERYLYSGLFFLLGSAVLQRRLFWLFMLMSGTFLLNLFFELPGHKTELKFGDLFYALNNLLAGKLSSTFPGNFQWFKGIALLNLLLFAWTVWVLWRRPLLEFSRKWADSLKRWGEAAVAENQSKQKLSWLPAPTALDRKDVWILGGILLVTALIKLWRLGFPPEMVFDEVYHARAAGEYILGIKPLEWVHPPLAKLLIAVGVLFYDLTGVGWRVLPVIAGTMLLASVYFLGRYTLPARWQAVLATVLLACDGVYFVQSRTAMTNIFATLFQVTALTLTWRFIQMFWHHPERKSKYVYFVGAATFIGLSLATRWTSLYSYGFMILALGFVVLVPSTIDLNALKYRTVRFTASVPTLILWLFIPGLTVMLPAVIYLLGYMPYYLNYQYDVARVLQEQAGIWSYHSNLADPHPYYSAWYTWPWLVRPTWYYFQNYNNGTLGGILALGNPAIWWTSMPFVAALLVLAWMQRKLNYFYLAAACLFMYLPWGLSPRTLNYAHYFFEAVPYACLSAAALMGYLVHHFKETGKWISGAYTALVIGLFFFFYPIYSALPIPWSYYNLLRWFPSWV